MAKLNRAISRRDFLKLSALTLGSLAFTGDFPPGLWEYEPAVLGRVTYHSISVFNAPEVNARQVAYRFQDTLMNLYEELIMESGPIYNPRWYRVWGGYVHSAYVQPVTVRLNRAEESVSPGGMLVELTVPYSRPYEFSSSDGWQATDCGRGSNISSRQRTCGRSRRKSWPRFLRMCSPMINGSRWT
jgi:hypothetical protein